MGQKKLTVFQELTNLFGPVNAGNLDLNANKYNINDVSFKTNDKAEYESTKLQKQQQKYLNNIWQKVDGEMFQQSMHHEVTRIGSYSDFESMEFYPEISAALDIFMEESCVPNERGKILNIYSGSDRVKSVLEDLFLNRLDLHTNLPMWTRNLAKYGDNFVFLKTDEEKGVIGCRQMPNFEMERREGDLYSLINSGQNAMNGDDDKDNKIKFHWKGKDIIFNSWQMAHFRLLGDDRKLPYGTCLKGDTRINTEFGVKEIKDLEIGTKVWSFNTKTQKKELSPILDKINSGKKEVFKISTRHNYIDASKEHKVLVATDNGEFIYKNVSNLQLGDLLVLNKNEHTNKKIEIPKLKPIENKNGWFNNIDCIPDVVTEEFAQLFGFLIGDGWIPKHNDQVSFALGTDIETNNYYINLLENYSNKTHIKVNDRQVHVNSKLLSTILKRMGFEGKSYEKRIPEWVFEMETNLQKAFVSGLMDADGWATRDQWVIALHIELNNKELIKDLKILLQRIGYKSGSIRSRVRKKPIIEGREIKTIKESHLITFFDSYLNQMKKYEFKNRKKDNFILEPIQSIESIGEDITYDIYVENENHNFYANNVIVHNSVLEKARRIWKQCVLEDTRVWTDNGYKEIKDITTNDIIYTYDYNNNKLIPSEIQDCWKTGEKKTYEIRSRYNNIEVTDDHPILAFNNGKYEYKTINEVIPQKDYIVTPINKHGNDKNIIKVSNENYYISLNNTGLNKANKINRVGIMSKLRYIDPKNYKNVHRFLSGKGKIKYKHINDLTKLFNITLNDINVYYKNTPAIVNKNLEYVTDIDFVNFFGFMLGDGWLNKSGISFALGVYEGVNVKYINYIKTLIKSKYHISQSKTSKYSKAVHVHSKELKEIFKAANFITGFNKKIIPNWVYSLNLNNRREFIKGLFEADGSWDWGVIGLSNKKLITDLKELCNQSGIASGKILNKPKNIKYNPKTKKTEIRQETFKLYINFNNIVNDVRHEKIIDIKEKDIKPVWDLTTKNEIHNFIGNGVTVHNCLLSEDAMLIYRVTRAPERRIYKVYVGNIDDQDVQPYVEKIADRFKRRPVIDPQTGQIDLRYNQMAQDQDFFIPVRDENAPNPIDTLPGACIALDTKIPLLDGRVLELNKIINEWNGGNRDLWIYSCDPETGKIVPGQITWAGETRKNADVIKVTLDNGEEIITTPDHKWVHRTNGFVETQDLNINDSLMPYYHKKAPIRTSKSEYKQIWDNNKEKWVYVHRMVGEFLKHTDLYNEFTYNKIYLNENKKTIHHKDINRFNNNPSNLCFMNNEDHYKYHSKVFGDKYSSIGGKALWEKLKTYPQEYDDFIKNLSNNTKKLWANRTLEEINIIKNKQSNGLKKYINNLSNEQKTLRYLKNINDPDVKSKTTKTLIKWNKIKDNLVYKGKLISKAKSSTEFKEKFSKYSKKQWENKEYREKVFSKKQNLIFTDKLYNMFFEMFKGCGKIDLTLKQLNNTKEFLNEFIKPNKNIRSSLTNLNEFTRNHLDKMLKQRGFKNYREWCKITAEELGYKNVRAWRYYIQKEKEIFYNHKITKIEWLDEKQNTGTITVDGNEKYHNYHTFAIESGVFIKNSNLSEIADIEFLQRKLFTALRVPKTFLGFEEPTGEGKNLALQDIRFSRTINRLQQAVIMELNKVAIIHLHLLGFHDDLDDFTLTLNNPSTQAEMLKIEHLQNKITLYNDAVRDSGNGFAAMSMTRAKRDIFNWSDDETKQDLLEQRMEKAAAAELENTSSIIKKTGLFDKVDMIYGDPNAEPQDDSNEDKSKDGNAPMGGGGGVSGSPDFGAETDVDLDFGEEGEGNEEGGEVPDFGEEGEGNEEGEEVPDISSTEESLTQKKNLIKEQFENKKKKYQENYFNKLIKGTNKNNDDELKNESIKFHDKNLKFNSNINNMIDDIDNLINE